MNFDEYLKIKAVNSTALKAGLVSPKHMLHSVTHGLDDNDTLREGRAIHTAVLEPMDFLRSYALMPETWPSGKKATRAGQHWAAFQEANQGKTILTRNQYETALGVRDAVMRDKWCRDHLVGCATEQSFQWVDDETGLACKARLDAVGDGYFIDLKKAARPGPFPFGRQAGNLGYHVQCAFYERALVESRGGSWPCWLLVVEPVPPFDIIPYRVEGDTLETGRAEMRRLLNTYAACMQSGEWPGIALATKPDGGGELSLEIPSYLLGEDEELIIDGEAVAV